jgi:hypothetical protein
VNLGSVSETGRNAEFRGRYRQRGLGSEIWYRWGSVFVAGDWQGFAHGCTAWTAAAAAVEEALALEA